jgi:hypothetical protein
VPSASAAGRGRLAGYRADDGCICRTETAARALACREAAEPMQGHRKACAAESNVDLRRAPAVPAKFSSSCHGPSGDLERKSVWNARAPSDARCLGKSRGPICGDPRAVAAIPSQTFWPGRPLIDSAMCLRAVRPAGKTIAPRSCQNKPTLRCWASPYRCMRYGRRAEAPGPFARHGERRRKRCGGLRYLLVRPHPFSGKKVLVVRRCVSPA